MNVHEAIEAYGERSVLRSVFAQVPKKDRLRPVEAKPDRWSWLRTTGYFAITALISVFTMAGIVLAFVFVGLFAVLAAVPWGIWKLRRDWR